MNVFGCYFSKPRRKTLIHAFHISCAVCSVPNATSNVYIYSKQCNCNNFIIPSPIETVQHLTATDFSFISLFMIYLSTTEYWSIIEISWTVSIKIENISDCFIRFEIVDFPNEEIGVTTLSIE